MIIVPFEPDHLSSLALQEGQAYLNPVVQAPEHGEALARAGDAYTALEGATVIGCAGMFDLWPNRATVWATLSQCGPGRFLSIHRAVGRYLKMATARRLETAVDCEFGAGIRWAEMLGFRCEGRMRAYGVDGRDCYMYARVINGR